MPIFAKERPMGRIEIIGAVSCENSILIMEALSILVESVQAEVCAVIYEHETVPAQEPASIPQVSVINSETAVLTSV